MYRSKIMNILIIDDNIHFSKIIKNDVLNFFRAYIMIYL